MLRALNKTATAYPELSRAEALAQHVRLLAAACRRSITLPGVPSAVRMCEKIGIFPTTFQPLHWAMAAGADRVTPEMLAHMAAKVVCLGALRGEHSLKVARSAKTPPLSLQTCRALGNNFPWGMGRSVAKLYC